MERSRYTAFDGFAQGVGRYSTVASDARRGAFLRPLGTKVGPNDMLGIGKLATSLYASDEKSPQPFRHRRFVHVDVIYLVMYVRDSGESRFST